MLRENENVHEIPNTPVYRYIQSFYLTILLLFIVPHKFSIKMHDPSYVKIFYIAKKQITIELNFPKHSCYTQRIQKILYTQSVIYHSRSNYYKNLHCF